MAIKKYDEDGSGKDAVPLRVIDAAPAVARPANRSISRRLSQPEGKHPPEADQRGLRWNKRSGWRHDNLGNGRQDCRRE